MVDFASMKNRKTSGLEALQKQQEMTKGAGSIDSNKNDPRFWRPTMNSENTSENVIRLLSIAYVDFVGAQEGRWTEEELTPVAKIVRNNFKGPTGRIFNEKSMRTFGEKCPVSEYSFAERKQIGGKEGSKADQDRVKQYFSKDEYICGILVIEDGTKPENNGKVFLYEYKNAVNNLIEQAANPKLKRQIAFDPFDLYAGANLNLDLVYEKKKIGSFEGMVPVYDNAKWDTPAALFGGDDTKIEEVWKQQYSVMEFRDRSKFKTYDEQKKQFCAVMGFDENYNSEGTGKSLGKNVEAAVNNSLPTSDLDEIRSSSTASSLPSSSDDSNPELDDFKALLNQ